MLFRFIEALSNIFAMKDLGDLHHFLGVCVTRTPSGLLLSQEQYATDLLKHYIMHLAKPVRTPLSPRSQLSSSSE